MSKLDFTAMGENAQRQKDRWEAVVDDPAVGEKDRDAARHAYTAWASTGHAASRTLLMTRGTTAAVVGHHARDVSRWGTTAGEELMAVRTLAAQHPSETTTAAEASTLEAGNVSALLLGFVEGFITNHFINTGEWP